MPFHHLPVVDECCGCVPDLKIATVIIAVLGIVTSPSISWAMVRHSYVIRVSCFITTGAGRPDIVDINLNNVLSFGFGPNAGIGSSCLMRNSSRKESYKEADLKANSAITIVVKVLGWLALIADLVFVITSVNLLINIFQGNGKKAAKVFMIAASIAMVIAFIYGITYLTVCIFVGGAFPMFEVLFTFIDFILWLYFLAVVNSYRRKPNTGPGIDVGPRNV